MANVKTILCAGVLFLLFSASVKAQTYQLTPFPRFTPLDANGKVMPGACLNSFLAGTTTPTPTYADTLGTVNTNPVIADASGRMTVFLSTATSYKLVLTSAGGTNCVSGSQVWSQDNITPASSSGLLSLNNAWTGTNSFAAATTFNGAVNANAGGTLAGTFTGTPTYSGQPTFSAGISASGTSTIPGASLTGNPSVSTSALPASP